MLDLTPASDPSLSMVAHRLDPALQTGKLADYERIRCGQALSHKVAVLWHMLNQINQWRRVEINYQG